MQVYTMLPGVPVSRLKLIDQLINSPICRTGVPRFHRACPRENGEQARLSIPIYYLLDYQNQNCFLLICHSERSERGNPGWRFLRSSHALLVAKGSPTPRNYKIYCIFCRGRNLSAPSYLVISLAGSMNRTRYLNSKTAESFWARCIVPLH